MTARRFWVLVCGLGPYSALANAIGGGGGQVISDPKAAERAVMSMWR
jgi:hypothetical protein